jgi:hypothetical protein
MAITVSGEVKLPLGGQTPGMALVFGVATEDSQGTGGVISGSTQKVRKIYSYGFTPQQNITGGAFNVVKSYDSTTYDSDILTITCTASDVFDYWYIGEDNGSL